MSNNKTISPPEGGWGYLILTGLVFCFIFTIGTMTCLGILYGDFLRQLNYGTKALTLLPSIYYMAFSIVGLFTNYLFKKFSIKLIGLFGGIIFCTGSVQLIFVQSLNQLLVAYGIFQGIGFGIMLSVSLTLFNQYFIKKRIMMMGLAQTFLGLASIGLPLLFQFLIDKYGFRGCMAILAALNFHTIFGMMVMHPVEWHINKNTDIQLKVYEKNEVDMNLLDQQQQSIDTKCDIEIISSDIVDNKIETSLWQKIVDFLDLSLLKDFIYLNICFGISFALYSDVSFFTIQPLYLYKLSFTKIQTAQIVSIGASVDLLSRIFLTIISIFIIIKSRYIYLAGAIFTIIARLYFPYVTTYVGMAVMTGILGFFRAWLHVPISIVFAEYLKPERFPSGYGLFMFIQGLVIFFLGPLAGWLRDITDSYFITFNWLTLSMVFCALPWTIELFWARRSKTNVSISEK